MKPMQMDDAGQYAGKGQKDYVRRCRSKDGRSVMSVETWPTDITVIREESSQCHGLVLCLPCRAKANPESGHVGFFSAPQSAVRISPVGWRWAKEIQVAITMILDCQPQMRLYCRGHGYGTRIHTDAPSCPRPVSPQSGPDWGLGTDSVPQVIRGETFHSPDTHRRVDRQEW